MIFARTEDKLYMVNDVRWIISNERWIPTFVCIDGKGETHELNPMQQRCTFILGDEAQLLNIAFATIGDTPLSNRFVTEANESDADRLETLNKNRDIIEAIEYIEDETLPPKERV